MWCKDFSCAHCRYFCILNVFFYICIWTIVCNKEFIIITSVQKNFGELNKNRNKNNNALFH